VRTLWLFATVVGLIITWGVLTALFTTRLNCVHIRGYPRSECDHDTTWHTFSNPSGAGQRVRRWRFNVWWSKNWLFGGPRIGYLVVQELAVWWSKNWLFSSPRIGCLVIQELAIWWSKNWLFGGPRIGCLVQELAVWWSKNWRMDNHGAAAGCNNLTGTNT
jgi:hypothetical protein